MEDLEVGEYHSHDGHRWKRLPDGSVRHRTADGAETVYAASVWPSLVATMAPGNGTADEYHAANTLHEGTENFYRMTRRELLEVFERAYSPENHEELTSIEQERWEAMSPREKAESWVDFLFGLRQEKTAA